MAEPTITCPNCKTKIKLTESLAGPLIKNGGRYNYYDVPDVVYEGMKGAASYGQFLAQNIKGKYRYARV